MTVNDSTQPRRKCEGSEHSLGTYGHDAGPARFRVLSSCKACGFRASRLYCEGRVDDMRRRSGLFCSSCGALWTVDELVVIRPLAADDSRPPLRSVSEQNLASPATWAHPINGFLSNLARSGSPKPTRTLRSYHLRRFAIDSQSDPWAVTLRDLNEHIDRRDWEPSTAKTFRSTMREFYKWAITNEYTDNNPADKLPRIRVAVGTPRPASDESLDLARANADDREWLMIRFAALAGLRCREIALIRRDDLTHTSFGWSLLVHGKGDRNRHVPLPDDLAADALAAIADESDGWLFEGQVDGHLSAPHVSKLISRALPGATAHQLRHRFATRAYQLGGRDIRAVQELLGHASVATTQIYTGVESDALRRAALAAGPEDLPLPDRSGGVLFSAEEQ